MTGSNRLTITLTLLSLIMALLLGACQGGQISVDIGGTNGDGGSDDFSVANQTLFMLMIVLLVAMFAMVLVAISSR